MYAGKTCGLCGNYNGNKGDDFRTAAGLVEPLVERFGNAWKLREDCEDLQRQHGDPCQLNPRLSMWRWGEGGEHWRGSPEVSHVPAHSTRQRAHP